MSRSYNVVLRIRWHSSPLAIAEQCFAATKIVTLLRSHSDFWMLRFFKFRPNLWDEIKRMFKFGPPRVDAQTK
jgi:hypothetical protein